MPGLRKATGNVVAGSHFGELAETCQHVTRLMWNESRLRMITVAVMSTVVLLAEVVYDRLALRREVATLFLTRLEDTVHVAPWRYRDLIARLKQVDLTRLISKQHHRIGHRSCW